MINNQRASVPILLALIGVLIGGADPTRATIVDWQSQVNSGTIPALTYFNTVSGTAPVLVNVGTLTGDSSFEFIVNAGLAGPSSAFLGNRSTNGTQGLKFEQWMDSGVLGITNFGVLDILSDDAPPLFSDTHIVFSSNGTDTNLYVNGTSVFTFLGVPLQIFGEQGLAGIVNGDGSFNDLLDGNILGFASYDSALSASEVQTHSAAYFVPEPGTAAMLALATLAVQARRRRLNCVTN